MSNRLQYSVYLDAKTTYTFSQEERRPVEVPNILFCHYSVRKSTLEKYNITQSQRWDVIMDSFRFNKSNFDMYREFHFSLGEHYNVYFKNRTEYAHENTTLEKLKEGFNFFGNVFIRIQLLAARSSLCMLISTNATYEQVGEHYIEIHFNNLFKKTFRILPCIHYP